MTLHTVQETTKLDWFPLTPYIVIVKLNPIFMTAAESIVGRSGNKGYSNKTVSLRKPHIST